MAIAAPGPRPVRRISLSATGRSAPARVRNVTSDGGPGGDCDSTVESSKLIRGKARNQPSTRGVTPLPADHNDRADERNDGSSYSFAAYSSRKRRSKRKSE